MRPSLPSPGPIPTLAEHIGAATAPPQAHAPRIAHRTAHGWAALSVVGVGVAAGIMPSGAGLGLGIGSG